MTIETAATAPGITADSSPCGPEPVDHKATVQRLIALLIDRLGPAALGCAGEDVRHLDRNDVVRVSAFDVRTASGCQAKAAAPPEVFEPNLHTATRAIAVRAGRRARRFPTLLEAVADTVRQLRLRPAGDSPFDPDEWLILYLQSLPFDMRARLVARATTWLTATMDLVGGSDVLDHRSLRGWQWEPKAAWSYPGRGLRLETKIDVALPQPGNFMPVMVVTGTHPAALDQVAYSTVLWTINRRRVPNRVMVVAQSEQRATILNPDELFEPGVEAAARAVEAVGRRPSAATDQAAVAEGDKDSHPGLFPLNLAVSPSFWMCVDCSWRTHCSARHPDAGMSRACSEPDHRPRSEVVAVTVRGGIRMPSGDRGRT